MTATHAVVTINSIRVLDSSVNSTSEPGSSAEWFMTFVVNGQSAKWSRDDVKDDTVYAVNRVFPNVPLTPNGMISIQVSGYEHDSTSANDVLPTLEKTHHPADEFALGTTTWADSQSSPEGSYKIEYSIFPTQGQFLTVAREFVGVYRSGSGPYALWSGDWVNFTKRWKELSESGMRLTRLISHPADTGQVTFGDSSVRYFTGIFEGGKDGHGLWVNEWPAFEAQWKKVSAEGLRLVDLAVYKDAGKTMFAGVYRAGNDPHALWVAEWPSFEKKWVELSKQGLRLVAIDTYKAGGKRIFAGVFRAGSDRYALWVGSEWKAFLAKRSEFAKQSLRLVDIASYGEGGTQRFAGVFRAGTDLTALKRGSWTDFVEDWQTLSTGNGLGGPLRLVSMESLVEGTDE